MSFIELPLHGGHVPRWLFTRMITLASEILTIIGDEFGPHEVLRRLGDPLWFHAFSLVIGFDWDSSGTTTVTTAVIREAVRRAGLEVLVAGGKGKMALATPEEIDKEAERLGMSASTAERLKMVSRLAAKVDSCLLQDGYTLYHHFIAASKDGCWAVVQQGMNPELRLARRYHWTTWTAESMVREPHSGLLGFRVHEQVLNLTSRRSEEARRAIVDLAKEPPEKIKRDIMQAIAAARGDASLLQWIGGEVAEVRRASGLRLIPRKIDWRALERAYQLQPRSMEELLLIRGLGPGTVRALALVAEIIYGTEADWADPLRYGYAFGGKDGVPYPVNRERMDRVIGMLREAIEQSRLGNREKLEALRRLTGLVAKARRVYYLVRVR